MNHPYAAILFCFDKVTAYMAITLYISVIVKGEEAVEFHMRNNTGQQFPGCNTMSLEEATGALAPLPRHFLITRAHIKFSKNNEKLDSKMTFKNKIYHKKQRKTLNRND